MVCQRIFGVLNDLRKEGITVGSKLEDLTIHARWMWRKRLKNI
ncbi:MAG: hypothetical protein QW702_04005 [Candidatus Bathyarchaeia archaeon]